MVKRMQINKNAHKQLTYRHLQFYKYPAPESNRHGFPQVFETSASTNSASWALLFQWAANVFKLSCIRNKYFLR